MDLNLTEEQRMMEDMTRNFAQNELKPVARDLDATGEFPVEIVKKLSELGLMGVCVPEEYGGAGMDTTSYTIAVEEIAAVCGSTSVIVAAGNSLVAYPLLTFGTEDQKKKYLMPIAQGEKIGAFGLTEPGAGSDAAALKTTATLDGDSWVINGSKRFISCATHAEIAIVFAVTDKEKGSRGISTFIVERDRPGFSVGKHEEILGIRATGNAELIFEECRIPKENLLGNEGEGFKIAMITLDTGRIAIAAQAVGIARGAFEECITYSKERVQFGKPLAKLQAIQWMIADMATEIDAARLLVRRAAWLKDSGARLSKESAMCKLFASEVAMRATTKAIQVHGGYGYSKEYNLERYFRDAKITEIYEGTSEIQRLVIAANLLR